ncbi:MAG: rhomboid family intramembrane serine protease [Acidimicrobiales bacterium]|nr:rhomboid family intramembrane serine protease [Acidimicrobiales bacterium]HJM26421.1 rhomboid family intramembrane serine protease [Acidimicrobiales bacterium]
MSNPMDGDTCAWHPDRRAGVSCQRCNRVICGECMYTASVGFHCPECAGPIVTGRPHRRHRRTAGSTGMHHDDGRSATTAIIGLNIAAFLGTLVSGGSLAGGGGNATIDFGLLGYGRVRDGFTIVHIGIAEGEWWRLATGAFLHGGLLHLVFNMFLAWMLGHQLERLHGSGRFVGLYAASLAAGSLGVMLLDPLALTVGASGAVFGLMGATLVHQLRRGINPWSSGVGGLVVINLVFTVSRPGISLGGHVGGLIGGAVVAWMIDEADRRRASRSVGSVLTVVSAVVFAAAAVWAAGNWADPLLG